MNSSVDQSGCFIRSVGLIGLICLSCLISSISLIRLIGWRPVIGEVRHTSIQASQLIFFSSYFLLAIFESAAIVLELAL